MARRGSRAAPEDFLDEVVRDEARRTPEFPAMVEAALERRRLAAELARARGRLKLSQVDVARRIETAQSVISKLEAGGDVKVSTLLRYADALGLKVALVRPRPKAARRA
ncbi:MAG: helix-turn-helix domain-containing protein [Planctomycetes bacterium]|nr:helix-turn-helix domain-containing protein [Planctomycetota bacterium]